MGDTTAQTPPARDLTPNTASLGLTLAVARALVGHGIVPSRPSDINKY